MGQQNHDGLPQKAGFPQERINEIHGSWFDPANPVVRYDGSEALNSLRWLEDDAASADLVLALGTSLGGLYSDQASIAPAFRSLVPYGGCLGTCLINLQQTSQDGVMTLRMFARTDDLFRLLLVELGFGLDIPTAPSTWPTERTLVPYDADGKRIAPDASKPRMWLEFGDHQRVRLCPGHNHRRAGQAKYKHVGTGKPYKILGDMQPPAQGVGKVVHREDDCWLLEVDKVDLRLGVWWLDVARRGAVETIPIVNEVPSFEEVSRCI